VVSPNMIGACVWLLRCCGPHVVGFLDLMIKGHSRTLRIEEILITETSPWVGKPLGQVQLKTRFNCCLWR